MSYECWEDADNIQICTDCIGDEFLRKTILDTGQKGDCTYCKKSGTTVSLQNLSKDIHQVIEDQFYLTSSDPDGLDYLLAKEGLWEREGELVEYIISEISGLDEMISEDVRAALSGYYGYTAVKDGGEDPYAYDAQYEERGPDPDTLNFHDTWESFCQQVQWRSRFFNQHAEIDLDNIFGDLESLKTHTGRPVICTITPEDTNWSVYRARIAQSSSDLEKILERPCRELDAPPSRLAQAGRMNAAGISVFYGGLEEDTCVAEVRAPVGSSVVVGRFKFIREVTVLDLDALAGVYVNGSHFDPEFTERRARVAFLRHLAKTISQPVMPNDEAFQYLPTQVVSEYLASRAKPPMDGMVFKSSQTGGVGRNFVLFNHAATTDHIDAPDGTEFSVYMDDRPPDESDPIVGVFEKVPPEEPQVKKSTSDDMFSIPLPTVSFDVDDEQVWLSTREPTLRLELNSVYVLDIDSVQYAQLKRPVLRSRTTKGEEKPF